MAALAPPVEELARLRDGTGTAARLLVKRDDGIAFAWGGNKVRKLEMVAAAALAEDADTLVTTGGLQSNHARVTAAFAARLGMRCHLVLNGDPPSQPRANALLDRLFGAEIEYVADRTARTAAVDAAVQRLRGEGRRPYAIPLGASTPLGAAAFAKAVFELLEQAPAPTAIVHSTSSAGTQSGLIAGCVLAGVDTRVIGVSADDPAGAIVQAVRTNLAGIEELLRLPAGALAHARIEVDDSQVGDGYGIPTPASAHALATLARLEALILDPVYTAKAMAGLLEYCRRGVFGIDDTVIFWHTGGQVAIFA
jgi:1-aminocyclopropane-1-carboxylate deaminase/D-cysteine desulfhydrase-like pyridoxal-dependent ACC family enzyme